MRRSVLAVAGIAAGAVLVPAGMASAAPAANGATVSLAAGHTQCDSQDMVIQAAGLAPGRKSIQVVVQLKGVGNVGTVTVPLVAGAGSVNVGPVAGLIPDGRYQLRTDKASPGRTVFPQFSFTLAAC